MSRAARIALVIWAAISMLVAASLWIIYLRLGQAGLGVFIQQPPLINLPVTLASVALVWLSAGVLLYLLQSRRITGAKLFSVAGFFLVIWVYLNFLSERWRYGDYTYYWDAAVSMRRHQPLPGSYFYPPLWATLLQFLVPAGQDSFFIALWLLDFITFAAFYFLLQRVLERYGFASRLAAVVTTVFMLANAPLLRTLVYMQVNIHTLDLVLLSVLLYPKRSFLSALMLALAVHLKGSPAVLVLAFLLEKDWRWLGWFSLSMILVAGITVATNGVHPFLNVLEHVQGLAVSDNTIFHDTSIDSFLRFTGGLLQIDMLWTRILIYASKVLLAGATILVMLRCVRRKAFLGAGGQGANILNALPPLFILMTLASPVVWEHHAVFVALSFLLMLKRLELPSEWLWFGFAYLLEFLLPTFDFFPWSFGRLVAPLIVLWLTWRTAAYGSDPPIFKNLNLWFERLPALKITG